MFYFFLCAKNIGGVTLNALTSVILFAGGFSKLLIELMSSSSSIFVLYT